MTGWPLAIDNDDDSWRDELETPSDEPDPPKRKGGPLRLATGTDDRPDILLVPDTHTTTAAMIVALRVDPDLYTRAGSLTRVVRENGSRVGLGDGTPVAQEAPLSWLVDRVSMHARCLRLGKNGEWKHSAPPADRVKAVKDRGEWPGLRPLRGVLEAPALRPDGTLIQTAGYDAATGYLYAPNEEFLPVAEAPSRSDCVAAYARLCEPFADFPYADPAHKAAVVAAILTLFARPAIHGSVPCWFFDASAKRSGKSLQVDVVSIIATGRHGSRMSYPEIDEELEKVLSAYALRGVPVVNFDNVARPFGGAALDKCITATDTVDLRILGSTEIRTVPWSAVVFASGNNVTFRGDMLARILCPRLETPHENPEQRDDMAIQDLRGWTTENRRHLAHAALTILRGYCAAGRPEQPGVPRWGGFEQWSRLIPHALVWLGAPDPMGARRGLKGDDDPERAAEAAFVSGWGTLCRTFPHSTEPGLTAKEACAHLWPSRRPDPDSPPDGLDELRDAAETLTNVRPGISPSSKMLGFVLRRLKMKPLGGRRIAGKTNRDDTVRWWVESVG